VAILFVSDRKSWEEMSQIERELGKEIVKISTDDFDAMEQVSWGAIHSTSINRKRVRRGSGINGTDTMVLLLLSVDAQSGDEEVRSRRR
jgi:hypothetical protein